MSTHAMPDVAGRAAGYGIPGVIVDGNDVLAVHETATKAIARARAGEGPTLIECKTYRHRAHTERKGQPDYRPQDEIALWKSDAHDPIARLVAHLKRQQGQLTDDEWKEMDNAILARIEKAVAFAKASPFPKPEAATEDVFAVQ
jgi:pyruvate dehydrogenase E1 component alpha subunit